MHTVLVIISLLSVQDDILNQRFTDVQIEDAFRPYLASNLLLMEVAGTKIIRLPDGKTMIIAVASTVLKDESAKERLRAERVCRTKALANLVAERNEVQVCRTETLKDQSRVVIDAKGESGTSVSELLQITTSKVAGIAKDMPVVGRWKSKQGDVLYLAIGTIVNRDGDTGPENP